MVFELGKGLWSHANVTKMHRERSNVSKLGLGVKTKSVVLSTWVHRPCGWGEERSSQMTPGSLCILLKCGNMLFRDAFLQRGLGNFQEVVMNVQEHP